MPNTSIYKVVLVVISGAFMVVMDQTIMNVALPRIIAVFNETTDRAQLVVSAYMLATALRFPCLFDSLSAKEAGGYCLVNKQGVLYGSNLAMGN